MSDAIKEAVKPSQTISVQTIEFVDSLTYQEIEELNEDWTIETSGDGEVLQHIIRRLISDNKKVYVIGKKHGYEIAALGEAIKECFKDDEPSAP